MKFLEYLRDNKILDNRAVSALRDNAAMAKRSIYQELYICNDDALYAMPYNDLEKHILNAAEEEGVKLNTLHATAGCMCDVRIYERLGGIDSVLVKRFLPLRRAGEERCLALTIRPDDPVVRDRIERAYRDEAYALTICPPDIWNALYYMYVEPLLLGQMAEKFSSAEDTGSNVSEKSRESDARKFYTMLMNVGVERHASDVHFIPCSDTCKVLFRIDGVNHEYTQIPKDVAERISNILKADGAITVPNPHMPVDGKVRYSPSQGANPGDEIDLRVSIIPTKGGSDLNVRYLSDRLYTFDELGMSLANMKAYKDLLNLPSGLIVQVGPTGSGKSTTLYAGLAYVHESLRNIITVEDPVEILMDGISQIDVNADNKGGLVFSEALKACLRHDPDVVVVGELRDNATAFEAVRAANTGHLVLTSLHTNDSVGAFERLINLGIDSYSLGEVVAAIMGQRLVRRLCPHCKQAYQLDLKSELAREYYMPERDETITIYKACGCTHCNNTGYSGRVAINEVLCVDPELRNIIQRHGVRKVIEEHLRSVGFKTMYQDGLDKVYAGITSLEEMTKFAKDTIAFKG